LCVSPRVPRASTDQSGGRAHARFWQASLAGGGDFKDVLEDNSCEVVARRAPNRRDSRVEDRNEGDRP